MSLKNNIAIDDVPIASIFRIRRVTLDLLDVNTMQNANIVVIRTVSIFIVMTKFAI